jgi:short-subunit dehydrogenase
MKYSSKEDRSVQGKWVLLTGAGGGIGGAIAKRLYTAGANLILVGRDKSKLLSVCIRNNFLPDRVVRIAADLTDQQGREKIVSTCSALPEPVSILVNNAGISDFNFLDDQDEQIIIDLVNTNLVSPILLTRRLMPILRNANQPVIVNIGSTFGSIGYPGFATYSASKFGLRGFSEALRRELSSSTIKVCYIAPRATQTAINSDQVNKMNTALGTQMDDVNSVAEQILEALLTRKAEAYIGWPEKLFVKINQIFPKIVDNSILKQLPIISKYAR